MPGKGDEPAIWLLGSSGYSAQLAGMLGLPFAFAHHFSPRNTRPRARALPEELPPSEVLTEPYAMVACAAIVAADDERARWLSGPARLSMARLRAGRADALPDARGGGRARVHAAEEASVSALTGSAVIGGPETVRAKLDEAARAHQADELMVTTMVHDHADRIRSYELVADLFELSAVLSS